MARKSLKKQRKDNIIVRYLFYFAALFFIGLSIFYIYEYSTGSVTIDVANTITSITVSMMFSTVVISYLFLRGKTLSEIIKSLGLSRDRFNRKALFIGVKLFFIIFLLEIITTLISQYTSVQLPTNVDQILSTEPIYFLIFAAFLAPINEEIFFRAFLVPRLGIFLSALIFAVLHSGYSSISELAAALLFGIAAGYYYKKYGSLYATILAHVTVNFLAIVAFVVVGAGAIS
ncbi:MAG: CPBP family intramembrane glutamic endopeptidase [Candidatus Micrarchaeales archaeon]